MTPNSTRATDHKSKIWLLTLCAVLTAGLYAAFLRFPLIEVLLHRSENYSDWLERAPGEVIGYLFIVILIIGLYLAAYKLSYQISGKAAWVIVLVGSLVFAGILMAVYPIGSNDMFDYIVTARITSQYGGNPFFDTGSSVPHDFFYEYAYWNDEPSFYGPLWELMAGLVAIIAGQSITISLLLFKAVPGVFLYLCVFLASLLLKKKAPQRLLPGVVLLAWNPLLLFETFTNGHNDIVMAAFILLAIYLYALERYSLGVIALVAGGLIKFIPLLLIPAAGLIALYRLPDAKAKWRFVWQTTAISLVLTVVCYLPFWRGFETLTFLDRSMAYTGTFATVVKDLLEESPYDQPHTTNRLPMVFNGLTVLFALAVAWKARHEKGWLALPKASVRILLFYTLFGVSWFMAWYPMWPFVVAAVLPRGRLMDTSLFFTFIVFWGHFFFNPLMNGSAYANQYAYVDLLRFMVTILPVWLFHGFRWGTSTEPEVPQEA